MNFLTDLATLVAGDPLLKAMWSALIGFVLLRMLVGQLHKACKDDSMTWLWHKALAFWRAAAAGFTKQMQFKRSPAVTPFNLAMSEAGAIVFYLFAGFFVAFSLSTGFIAAALMQHHAHWKLTLLFTIAFAAFVPARYYALQANLQRLEAVRLWKRLAARRQLRVLAVLMPTVICVATANATMALSAYLE